MSERFLYTIWNRLPFRFRQRLKQNVKRNMQEQYAESEQELYRRTEQFLLKQGKIIFIEVIIGGLLLAVVLAWHIFKPDYILLKRNPFGQGTKEVQISLQKGNKKKQIQYKLEEQKISLKERQKVYQAFFKQLKKEMRGRNPSLYKVSEALNLPESIAGYPFEIMYELPEDGSVHLDGTLSEEVQTQLHKGECHSRYIIVTAHYREYKEKRKYKISIVPKEASSRKSAFYQVQKYLKRTEKASRHESDVKILSSYGEAKIRAGQQEAGGRGAAVLFLVTCLCIPVHNYLKLKEEGERHRKEAEKDFPVIVHLLTLYMGAGLSFLSAVRRIGFHYQEQKEADAKQKKYAFERVLLMEQQMNNGMSQKEACQNWGMQFHSEAYQKLALILVQSFTKGSKEASTMMEAEEREAFQRRVERAKQEGEEAATRLLFPMIVLLCQVMLLVMYPALIRFQGILDFQKDRRSSYVFFSSKKKIYKAMREKGCAGR